MSETPWNPQDANRPDAARSDAHADVQAGQFGQQNQPGQGNTYPAHGAQPQPGAGQAYASGPGSNPYATGAQAPAGHAAPQPGSYASPDRQYGAQQPTQGAGQMPWGGPQPSAGAGAPLSKPALKHADGSLNLPAVAMLATIVAQLFVIIGSLGPWASLFGMGISGMNGDGKITFFLALVAAGLTVAVLLNKLTSKALWAVVALSVLDLVIGLADINDYMAWGLVFVILFGVVAVAASSAAALFAGRMKPAATPQV